MIYIDPEYPAEEVSGLEAVQAKIKFRGECEKEPKRAAALGALIALAAREKANITEAQKRAAVMAEVQNILEFEVLSWTPRSETITGSLWRPQNPADCTRREKLHVDNWIRRLPGLHFMTYYRRATS